MTEEQAKTKWCPFARVVTVHPEAGMIAGPGNRTEVCGEDHFTKPMGSLCIASACMAWRTIPPKSLTAARLYAEDGEKIKAIKALREVFSDLDLLAAKNIVEGKTPWPAPPAAAGYCGLAGSPQ